LLLQSSLDFPTNLNAAEISSSVNLALGFADNLPDKNANAAEEPVPHPK
jgi:hypothetical protein